MDGHYDYTVPSGQLCQQHYNLIGCHAVQACGWFIQKDHLCNKVRKKYIRYFREVHLVSSLRNLKFSLTCLISSSKLLKVGA